MKIRQKLIIAVGLVLTVITVLFTVPIALRMSETLEHNFNKEMQLQNMQMKLAVKESLETKTEAAHIIAKLWSVSLPERLERYNALKEYKRVTPDVGNVWFADIDGRLTSAMNIGSDRDIKTYKDRAWYQEAGKDGLTFISPLYASVTQTSVCSAVSHEVRSPNGEFLGVIGMDVPLGFFEKAVTKQKEKAQGVFQNIDCIIFEKSGKIIYHPDYTANENIMQIDGETLKAPIEKLLSENSEMFFENTGNGKTYYYYASPIESTPWYSVLRIEKKIVYEPIRKTILIVVGLGFLALIVVFTVIAVTVGRIIKPLNISIAALKDISTGDGDLTVRLSVEGKDEIADMAKYFNETISKIAASVRAVGSSTHVMQEIGTELSTNMTETASSINQISANIEGVKEQAMTQAASITETSATMEEIIRTIKTLNGSIETQATSVAQSSSSIEEMVANIMSVTQTLNKADAAVQHLANATDDGKETVSGARSLTQKIAEESGSLIEASNVIQNIAGQTNLLAMNAAIEAAHAGDAGRGFAVVADEIRKLAEESSAQGKTITGTLKSLSAEIQELADSAQLVGEKFTIIFELSEEVKKTSSVLMQAMQEQENGSREVLSAIKNINAVTLEVRDGSAEMLKGGKQVAGEMKKLDDLTRVITESMNEMASGAVQINNAVQDVNQITQKNKEAIESLVTEVEKFKV